MDDNSIVELYWKRSESAITETANKYNGYCYNIAYNILANKEDSEESVSDTWLTAWNVIPPLRDTLSLGRGQCQIPVYRACIVSAALIFY